MSEEAPHPRAVADLVGHAEAEQQLLSLYRSGRVPHAILIGGAEGIGKATLAYRLARFVLANPRPEGIAGAVSLAVPAEHPSARRVAAGTHSNLLALERTEGDNGKLRSVITVDQVRRSIGFFGSTAAEDGWRICIVDSADELKFPEAANALLKLLEEPPPRSLFLLVSHAPGRLLPTIRSRCRRLDLRPLAPADVAKAVAVAADRPITDDAVVKASAAADGSVARALMLLDGALLDVRDRVLRLLDAMPATDPTALHALGDALGDERAFDIFVATVQDWLSTRLVRGPSDPRSLARVGEVWDKLQRAARETEVFNLERKPMVFAVFGSIAEAARHAS